MRRFLCFLFVATCLYSCFPEKVRIRSDKRISVSGKVVNGNTPVAGVPVVTYGIFDNYVNDHPSHKLGFGRTSGSGDFSFISLDTRNADISVSINPAFDENYRDIYATLHYVDNEVDRPTLLFLDEISIPQRVNFTVRLENTSGTTEQLKYTLTYKNQELYYLINERDESEEEDTFQLRNYRSNGGNVDASEGFEEEVLLTVEDSEIILTYDLGENAPQEISIYVTPQENMYVFEY